MCVNVEFSVLGAWARTCVCHCPIVIYHGPIGQW